MCSSSFFLTPSRFPGKATRKLVPPCPDLVCFDPHPHPISPEPRLFLKNSSTRSWTTSSTTPPPFVVASCRHHLTNQIVFRFYNAPTWEITFPDPSTSPAPYAREMRIHLATDAPTRLAEYMPYFSDLRDLTLIGGKCANRKWISRIDSLSTSIRSLTMKFVSITNV